jgi:cellulose synthase/poly-beta-1,6-N-acetylglucosamine synthase-like glycosyltransferase
MSHFGATFWVGAAALMRRAALEEIATERDERGHRVKIFIYDRILIEDAAATVDLLNRGWRIYHDLARLSYSATPPDFGALIIQRRRWANGGLLILPRLLGYALRWPLSWVRLRESAIRLPTLISAAMSGACLPLLLLVPFDDDMISLWMPVAGLLYFPLYGCDLLRSGYRLADLPRVYALNLLLMPILLGGTLQSLRQVCTGHSVPFRRTPKISYRTSSPPVYLITPAAALLYAVIIAIWDVSVGEYRHMAFSIFNGAMVGYAIHRFIGVNEWRDDVLACFNSLAQSWMPRLRMKGANHEAPYAAQRRAA